MKNLEIGFCVLFVFIYNGLVEGDYQGKHKSCGRNDYIQVNKLHLSPHPILVPGLLTLTGDVTVVKPITGRITAQVTVKKNMFMQKTFDVSNVCGRLTTHCPSLAPLGVPCRCPVSSGRYSVNQLQIPIKMPEGLKNLGSFVQSMLFGYMDLQIRLTNQDTGEEIFCMTVPGLEISKKPDPNTPKKSLLESVWGFFSG